MKMMIIKKIIGITTSFILIPQNLISASASKLFLFIPATANGD